MSGRHTVGRPRQTECNQACHIRHHQAVLRHCPPSISAVLGTERTGKEPEGPPPPPLLLSLSIKPQILTHLKSPSHRTHQLADIIVTVIVFIYRAVCGIFMTTSARENITLPSAWIIRGPPTSSNQPNRPRLANLDQLEKLGKYCHRRNGTSHHKTTFIKMNFITTWILSLGNFFNILHFSTKNI